MHIHDHIMTNDVLHESIDVDEITIIIRSGSFMKSAFNGPVSHGAIEAHKLPLSILHFCSQVPMEAHH